jgi:hypothetical protein
MHAGIKEKAKKEKQEVRFKHINGKKKVFNKMGGKRKPTKPTKPFPPQVPEPSKKYKSARKTKKDMMRQQQSVPTINLNQEQGDMPRPLPRRVRNMSTLGRCMPSTRQAYMWRQHHPSAFTMLPLMATVVKGSSIFPVEKMPTHQACMVLLDELANVLCDRALQRQDVLQPDYTTLALPSSAAFLYPAGTITNNQKPYEAEPLCMEYDISKVKGREGHGKHSICKVVSDPYLQVCLGTNSLGGKVIERAHRVICFSQHGPPPGRRPHVLHTCGNAKCISPRCVSWGTARENAKQREMQKKKRMVFKGKK